MPTESTNKSGRCAHERDVHIFVQRLPIARLRLFGVASLDEISQIAFVEMVDDKIELTRLRMWPWSQ